MDFRKERKEKERDMSGQVMHGESTEQPWMRDRKEGWMK